MVEITLDEQIMKQNITIFMDKNYKFKKLYRVFLLGYNEKNPLNDENPVFYKITNTETRLGTAINPFPEMPSLEEQIQTAKSKNGRIIDFFEINEHYLLRDNGNIEAILHDKNEIAEKLYFLALNKAIEYTVNMCFNKWQFYTFIDATVKGDREKAEKESKFFWEE